VGKAIKTIPNLIFRVAMADTIDKRVVVRKIAEASGRAGEEIEGMIAEKKAKFSGLLTDSGAAFMIAKEMGVELELEGTISGGVKISHLEEGAQNVDITVRVMEAFTPKKFEKNGRKGVFCNLIVADSTGEIRLTLWHRDVQRFVGGGIERGAILALKGCRVTSYNSRKQLDLGFGGKFSVISGNGKTLPKPRANAMKLNEIMAGIDNIDAYARVARVYKQRAFEKDGRPGVVINFDLADETAALRAAAWNELAESVGGLSAGKLIKIEGGYAKEGISGVELNLGWQARVIENPKYTMDELSKLSAGGIERKKIGELAEGENTEISAKVVEIQPGNLHYKTCPKCGRKVESISEGFVCNICGEVGRPRINAVIGFELGDSGIRMHAVAFGGEAEELIGMNGAGIINALEKEGAAVVIEDLSQKLVGREFIFRGRAKKNSLSGELEFVISGMSKSAQETRPESI